MKPLVAFLLAGLLGAAALTGCNSSVGQALARAFAPEVSKAPGFDTMQVRRMAVSVETGFEHDDLRAPLADAVTNALMRRGYAVIDRRSNAPVDVFADLTVSVGAPTATSASRAGTIALKLTRVTSGEVVWTARSESPVNPGQLVDEFTSGAELLVRQLPNLNATPR